MIRSIVSTFFISIVLANNDQLISNLASKCVNTRGEYSLGEETEFCRTDRQAKIEYLKADQIEQAGKKFYCISYEKKNGDSKPDILEFQTTSSHVLNSVSFYIVQKFNQPELI